MFLFQAVVLAVTLLFAMVSDVRIRRVPHWYWLPYAGVSLVPTFLLWRENLFDAAYLVTLLLVCILYLFGKKYHCGADVLALIMIALTMPSGLFGVPVVLYVIVLSAVFTGLLYLIPAIREDWKKRKIPFIVPIGLAVFVVLVSMV